ncbi:hypothetical protein MYP14_18910 [Rhodococcus pyridinivorans]|uniref:thioesterase II family protein n=1 Tax=Rhodococcus pyridinivorans TaxID=103816 RepID=UPI001FFFC71E|nr:hypothetical protein [Rhodococcus pyridinivorans]UPK62808.1 hypothetical protein MYP14_18910 [Rhodococcus pyridinivorans]
MSAPSGWLSAAKIDGPAVLAFPFAGCGPSIYNRLGDRLSCEWGVKLFAIRPPGIEARFTEDRAASHASYARDLASEIASAVGGKYAVFGHCGAIPYVVETLRAIEHNHGRDRLPHSVVFSGWGPPHKGLYGDLNFADLEQISYGSEVRNVARATGVDLIDEFVEIYAEQLEFDVRQQRTYVFDAIADGGLDIRIVGWSDDEVVPCDVAVSDEWRESFPDATIEYSVLAGGHYAFMEAPDDLCRILCHGLN